MATDEHERGLNGEYHDRGSCTLCIEMEYLQKTKEAQQILTGDGLLNTRQCRQSADSDRQRPHEQ